MPVLDEIVPVGQGLVGSAGRPRDPDCAKGLSPPPLAILAGGFLALGLLWRCLRYFLQFPIWGDEGLVLFDVVDCDYYGLTRTLPIFQIAPILFLWTERAVWQLLGASELAVRLPAFLAGCGGLLIFAWTARRFLTPLQSVFAIGFLAVSYWPLRHCCEVKPYALDLLAAAGMFHATLAWLLERRTRWLVFLSLWTPPAILASYPAVFVAGGMSLAMLPKIWPARSKARGLYALFNMLIVAAFAGHYFGVTRNQIDVPRLTEQSAWLQDYWRDSFPPASLIGWPYWLLKAHASSVFAFPVGGSDWVGTVPFLLAALGAWHLWSSGRRSLLLACLAPFGMTMIAAALHKYPYGGSPRLVQHLAPMASVLIGVGGARMLEWISSPVLRGRWTMAACVVLALFAVGGILRDLCVRTKAEHELAVRNRVEEFRKKRTADEPVLLCNAFGEAPIVGEWYLRADPGDIRRAEVLAEAPRSAWLVRFTLDAYARPTPEQVLSMLGERAAGWTIAESSEAWLPPGGPGDPGYYWTQVRIVRGP